MLIKNSIKDEMEDHSQLNNSLSEIILQKTSSNVGFEFLASGEMQISECSIPLSYTKLQQRSF